MKAWIERNQLLKLREESVLKFCKWLVGNGEYDSVNLFISSLNCYENQMKDDGRISVETAGKRFAEANGINHQQQPSGVSGESCTVQVLSE